jgi:4'-phosphopantetheinyl transferase
MLSGFAAARPGPWTGRKISMATPPTAQPATSWNTDPPPPLTPEARHLWLLELDAAPVEPGLLSADEAARAARLLDPGPRRRFVAARCGLRRILGGYLGLSPEALRFAYGPLGKPVLDGPASPLGFNLSHSGGLALLAVTEGVAVGVDLEPLREVPEALRIGRRILPPADRMALEAAPPELRSLRFLHAWTALEAGAKLHGGGVFQAVEGPCHRLHLYPLPGWLACLALPHPHALGDWQGFR